MKILLIIGFLMLYFMAGGFVISIVIHTTEASIEEDGKSLAVMTVVWPLMVLVVFASIGIAIGNKIIDDIERSREKHSV